MSINLSDELHAATTKGKLASAKEVYLDGDKENLQQVGEKTHQLEEAVKGIGVSGGASVATAVSYDNKTSGMTSVTAQGAIDELAAKDKSQDSIIDTKANKTDVQQSVSELKSKDTAQDAEIAKKANTTDVNSQMQEEQTRVNAELDKKFDKENIAQELGDSEDKVVSQFALPFKKIESPEWMYLVLDAEEHELFGIHLDGSVDWAVGIPRPIRKKFEEVISSASSDVSVLENRLNDTIESINRSNRFHKVDLKGKKISFLGDSLSTFQGYIPQGNAVYYPSENNDVTSVEQTWWYKLCKDTNAVLDINNSSSGSKVSGGIQNYSYTERCTNLGNPDYIIIHGGTNDIWQSVPVGTLHFDSKKEDLNINEFADAYDLMIRKILSSYPHANVVLVVPTAVSDEYTNIINSIAQHYALMGVTDLHDYDIILAAGHYQIAGMETVKEAVRETIFVNKNVDNVRGKTLVEEELANSFELIENDEWFNAMVDEENHILFGIKRDTGKPYFPLNEMYHVEQNEEFFALWKDAKDHILMGIRRDGQIMGEIHAVNALKETISAIQSNIETLQGNITAVGDKVTAVEGSVSALDTKVSTIDSSLQELLDVFSIQDNPEYMAVETDADGRILASTNADGSHYSYNMKSETLDVKQDKEDGKGLIDNNVAEANTSFEDIEERMSIESDADGKIMAYRDKDGVKHEHELEAKTLHVSNLNLKDNSVNDIQSALIANGFNAKTPIDWSESSFIQIPEPRFAIINITNIDSMPTSKTQNKKAFLEFWDMQGNYFKKHAIVNAQGRSSMAFPKKNVAIDLCDDEWIGDSTPKLRIGNWVSQDSFHMKANYTDFFRGVGTVTYKLYEEIVNTRGVFEDRPWKKALIDMSKIDTSTKSLGNPYIGDCNLLIDTGALCFPEGFPVACYLNGSFYGVFTWQLKKHRDNYHMDKAIAEHVHLDGIINNNYFWGGTINWSQFEIKNPKSLYAMGGNKYDADIKNEEIAGDTEVNAWIAAGKLPDGTAISSKIKKNLQLTAKVKEYILAFSQFLTEVKAAASTYESSSKTSSDLETFKTVFEKYFDPDNVIDYLILSDISNNYDGVWGNNWQLFTYDGKKWWIGLYDVDGTWGNHYTGTKIVEVLTGHSSDSRDMPFGYITRYYDTELKSRYAELADQGIISYTHISTMLKNFTLRIGTSFYTEEYSKWKDSPCISDSVVRDDYWELLFDEHNNPQTDTTETFDATVKYNIGDNVSFGINSVMGYFKFKCIKETVALESNTPHVVSTYSPIKQFMHCDNLYRAEKWIMQNTANMDKVYNYTRN